MPMSPYMEGLRELVGHRLVLIPAVAAVIRDDRGQVLLVQTRAGFWSLPAGAIDPGESPREAVIREVREETGLEVRPVRLLDALGGTLPDHLPERGRGRGHGLRVRVRGGRGDAVLRRNRDGRVPVGAGKRGDGTATTPLPARAVRLKESAIGGVEPPWADAHWLLGPAPIPVRVRSLTVVCTTERVRVVGLEPTMSMARRCLKPPPLYQFRVHAQRCRRGDSNPHQTGFEPAASSDWTTSA